MGNWLGIDSAALITLAGTLAIFVVCASGSALGTELLTRRIRRKQGLPPFRRWIVFAGSSVSMGSFFLVMGAHQALAQHGYISTAMGIGLNILTGLMLMSVTFGQRLIARELERAKSTRQT